MITDETRRRLRWHAGLAGDPLDPESVSGSLAAGEGVTEAVADLFRWLARLNGELNGPVPSAGAGGDDAIPRDVAYAVAELTRQLGETDQAWELAVRWTAILAGDVDDLDEHAAHERRARP